MTGQGAAGSRGAQCGRARATTKMNDMNSSETSTPGTMPAMYKRPMETSISTP